MRHLHWKPAMGLAATLCLLIVSASPDTVHALPIVAGDQAVFDFLDGQPSGSTNFSLYQPLGVSFPQWRYHQSSLPGNVSFPFVDDWGLVIEGGFTPPPNLELNFVGGLFQFDDPIDSISVDVGIQRSDVQNTWRLVGFDASGTEIGRVSSVTGPVAPAVLATSSLTLDTIGPISSVLLTTNRKIGVDTISLTGFSQTPAPAPIPEPNAVVLFSVGAVVVAVALRGKR